jgi:hypothetical protein
VELQANRQEFQRGENDKKRTYQKELADKENELKKIMIDGKIDANKAATMRARVAAYTEARKVLEGGGTIDQANIVLESVGLPGLEEFTIQEESGWGPWKKEEEKGYRIAGSGRKDDAFDLETMRRVGLEAMPDSQTAGKTPQPKKSKGMIAGTQKKPTLPPNMSDWDVTMARRDGKSVPVVITDAGPVEISQEEYRRWRSLIYGEESGAKTFFKNAKRVDYIPNTSPRPW